MYGQQYVSQFLIPIAAISGKKNQYISNFQTDKGFKYRENVLRYLKNIYVNCIIQWQTKFINSIKFFAALSPKT